MPVILTAEVEGLGVGDVYTGTDEAWLLASGYARKQAGPFTGPGLDNTGPADTTIALNREFTPVNHQIAETSNLPAGGTNDGILLKTADAPTTSYTGTDGAATYDETFASFDGFANQPRAGWPLGVASVLRATGAAATGLPAAGGTALRITGRGFRNVTSVNFSGTDGTALSVVDDQTINVTTPPKAAGTYDVQVVRGADTKTKTAAVVFV